MSDLRKAAEMALEFCEHIHRCIGSGSATIHWDSATWHQNDATIEALRQVLAQPEQEQPKHWSDCSVYNEPAYPNGECDCGGFDPNNKWHGLTEEEAEKLAFDVIVGGVSKALAQPEQEAIKQTYLDGVNSGIKAERERCAKIALSGTGEPIQVATLEILRKERERIAANIMEIEND